jgi:hypothetical protein
LVMRPSSEEMLLSWSKISLAVRALKSKRRPPHRNLGIPYAEPPLGNLRLKPPVVKNRLDSTTFNASDFGPGCLQPVWITIYSLCSLYWMLLLFVWQGVPADSISEDCLTINVFRPSSIRPDTKLPVVSIALYKSCLCLWLWLPTITAILGVSVHLYTGISCLTYT